MDHLFGLETLFVSFEDEKTLVKLKPSYTRTLFEWSQALGLNDTHSICYTLYAESDCKL